MASPNLSPSPGISPVLTTSPFFGGQGASAPSAPSRPATHGSPPRATPQRDPQATLLAELGLAYSGLEGFDEAASVGQAQLGQHMQSQLKNLLDAAADTPRPLGSPLGNSGTAAFSPQVRGSSSPKAQAALVRSCELRAPGPEYQGPKLEPEATVTLDFVMSLVRHFQHQRNVPLPARYLCRLLEDAEKILEIRDKDGPVHQLSLASKPSRRPHETENLVIVGDLHGQLADLLWIFFKVGVPSPNNRFLVNGDICDRGENATEIWALLFAFMSLWPESIYVHRGNHEDRLLNMDYHCGGFYDEVLRKYGRQGTGQMIYEKFGRIFARLPLASVIDNQIFVVHGGLSRGAPGSFLRLLRANRTRNPEIPSASMGASAVDLAFIDAMWADPQEYPGSSQNPRGPGLSAFGPDVTERFLAETGYALVVRSHQVPPNNDGFYVHHKGKLFTVFSASNYCGLTGNQGAVLVVKKDSQIEAVRHMAPPFEALQEVTIEAPEVADETPAAVRRTRQLQRQSTAGQVELREAQASLKDEERAQKMYQEVFHHASRWVVEKKAELFSFWEQCESSPPKGFITKREWEAITLALPTPCAFAQLSSHVLQDSLTAFSRDDFISYGTSLASEWTGSVTVDVCGLCGLEAADMAEAMNKKVEDACGQEGLGLRRLLRHAKAQPYDLVVLMAGTNDLEDSRTAAAPIATCIKCLHTACHVEGIPTVALSVPHNRLVHRQLKKNTYKERWTRVNALLEAWSLADGRHEGVMAYVDVSQLVPWSTPSFWDEDGLHFTAAGATALGRALAPRLLAALRDAAAAAPRPVPRPQALAEAMPMRLKVDACPGSPGGSGDVEMKDVGKSWLFYGDSLTAGYHAFGCLFEPYALALGEVLQMTEPHELWVCGLSGLAATELLERKSAPFISDAVGRTGHGLERLLSEKTFDLAFIMLGTNDLTDSEDEEIFSAIRQIHEECHRCQVKTVALGVPPSGAAARHRSVGDSRAKVNQQLQAWASSNSMTIFVDTGDLLPWEKDSELWELDGLHFSRLGSQTLGRRLAEHLVPLLREREQSGGEPNRKKKRAGSAARGRRGCGEDGMKAVVGEQMNWKTIGKVLRVKDTLTKEVDYRAFLGRFRVTVVGGPAGGQRWAEELLGRFYGRLLALKGDAGSLEELEGFLGGDDGQVSANDALKAFQWVLGNYITEEQTKALLRTLAAHALPDPSPVGRPLGVFEFLSRLDICFQQQASLNSKGSEKRLEKASPWARSVLGRLGRLLWMEDAEGSPKAASARMLQVFRYFDKDGDGLLQREEFSQAVKQLLAEYKEDLPEMLKAESASDERIAELVDLVDISGDGLVNYLEFLHAFQPVDRTPGRGLRKGSLGVPSSPHMFLVRKRKLQT
ncbi:unnamed protein product [Durusdinium trenchii]|uniref:protein-serine/threonine phosphatase n=1 Tax=Durusdinium trenchii TaxID=1381693 RepID=A0ABP0IZA3_9DINO